MRVALPPPPWIRAACLLAFAAFLVQLFVLDEPALVERLVNLTWDKLMHALAFGGVAALLWTGLGCDAPFVTWVLVTFTGAADELHQVFVPGRHADVLDLLADMTGASIALFALHRLAIRRKPCVESWARSRAATSSPSSSRA
jgi:VanZ family protein